jgi:hypothetical protein
LHQRVSLHRIGRRCPKSGETLLARCSTPLLRDATRCALTRAETHGWSPATVRGVLRGLALVLAAYPADAADTPVLLSQVRTLLRPHRSSSAARVAEVLGDLQLLADDTHTSDPCACREPRHRL